MKQELDNKLCKEFPLLYGDRVKPMQTTCMYWGFSCGDGWFDLLYELSASLEPLIAKVRKENEYGNCYACGCEYFDHSPMPSGKKLCKVIHKLPYRVGKRWYGTAVPQWKRDLVQAWTNEWNYKTPLTYKVSSKHGRAWRLWDHFKKLIKQDWRYTQYRLFNRIVYRYTNRLLYKLYDLGLHYEKPCHCNAYEESYPRASQVKEKFGTLRFYMTSATDEMYELIRIAEEKTYTTCEECGSNEGSQNDGGWVTTLCNPCRNTRDEERKALYSKEKE